MWRTRGAAMRHGALWACVGVCFATVAAAQDAAVVVAPDRTAIDPEPMQPRSDPPFETRARATQGRVALMESELSFADRTTQTPSNWTGDIHRPAPPDWVVRRMSSRDRFLQPLSLSSVYPDVTARIINAGGWNDFEGRGAEIDQLLYVSFFLVEIYAPLLTLRSGDTFDTDHFRLNLRIPIAYGERHAVSFFAGANLPVQGVLIDDAGGNGLLGYAYGGDLLLVNARVGFGVDRLVGEVDRPFEPTFLYDATFGVRAGRAVQLLLQADGRKQIGAGNAAIRLWPGLRIFPQPGEGYSIGLGAQVWFDLVSSDWSLRRAGGVVDLGYTFF